MEVNFKLKYFGKNRGKCLKMINEVDIDLFLGIITLEIKFEHHACFKHAPYNLMVSFVFF